MTLLRPLLVAMRLRPAGEQPFAGVDVALPAVPPGHDAVDLSAVEHLRFLAVVEQLRAHRRRVACTWSGTVGACVVGLALAGVVGGVAGLAIAAGATVVVVGSGLGLRHRRLDRPLVRDHTSR